MATLNVYDSWTAVPSGAVSQRLNRIYTRSRSANVKTSQWAERVKNPNVFVPPTNFSASISTVLYGYYSYVDTSGNGGHGAANSNYLRSAPSVDWGGLESKAVIQALNRLKDQKVNLAQAFAERGQTASLVTSTVLRFATAYRKLRKRDVQGCAHALGFSTRARWKGLSQTWLELQYGWKPLLSDVYGAVEELRKKDEDYPQRYRVKITGSATTKWVDPVTARLTDGNRRIVHSVRKQVARTDVYLYYSLVNPTLATASAIGFTNPAQLAWELVPYSFVVDWFVPIGSWLSTFDADLGYAYLGGCSTDHMEYNDNEYFIELTPAGKALYRQFYHGPQSRYDKTVVRTKYLSSPLPRFPGFKNPFSLHHLANALSLLKSSVR